MLHGQVAGQDFARVPGGDLRGLCRDPLFLDRLLRYNSVRRGYP